MDIIHFASQKTETLTFPAYDTNFAFLEGEKRGVSTA